MRSLRTAATASKPASRLASLSSLSPQPGRLWLPPLERGILRRGGAIFASRAQDSALIGVEIAIAVISGAGEENGVAHPAVRAPRRGGGFHPLFFPLSFFRLAAARVPPNFPLRPGKP